MTACAVIKISQLCSDMLLKGGNGSLLTAGLYASVGTIPGCPVVNTFNLHTSFILPLGRDVGGVGGRGLVV